MTDEEPTPDEDKGQVVSLQDPLQKVAFQDPFSVVTRERQKFLLLSSLLTLAFTFSVFHIDKISISPVEGTANISNTTLAWLFAAATVYLLLLFLVGAVQEWKLHALKFQLVNDEFHKYLNRLEEHLGLSDEASIARERQHDREKKHPWSYRDRKRFRELSDWWFFSAMLGSARTAVEVILPTLFSMTSVVLQVYISFHPINHVPG